MNLIKSKKRVADHGEVFTPAWMVEAMLDLVKGETERIDSRFLEPACGSGNFLVRVLRRKLSAVELKYGQSDFEKRHYALLGLMCIYGIELLSDNIVECRANLLDIFVEYLGLDEADDLYRAASFVLSLNLVHGDALTMKAMDKQPIAFANRIIYLNPEGRAQTNKRRAIVPMNDLLYDVLLKIKAQRKAEADKIAEETDQPVAPCDHVVAFRNAPVANIRTGFRLDCERAGIKGVTPHTLRHTAGTLMALAGIDLFLIAKVLGHSVQKTTEMYAHFQPSYLRGAVDVLAKATVVGRVPKVEASLPAVLH